MNKNNLLLLSLLIPLSSCNNVIIDNFSSDSMAQSESEKQSKSESASISESQEIIPVVNEVKTYKDYLGSDNDLYRINITTNDSVFPDDKDEYVNGSLNITEHDGSKTILSNKAMGVRLRGNSTLAAAKKAFKIKFESKQSLFGLTKAKKWVLLANYYDKSNIRNYLAYTAARKMTNLQYQPSSIFVDVYFNNEYYGVFLLCEQMEVNEGRIDIENNISEKGIDSMLIEVDDRIGDELPDLKGTAWWNAHGYNFSICYPDADDYIEALENQSSSDPKIKQEADEFVAQYEKDSTWIKQFIASCNESILSDKNYEDYIDVDSFVDYYLVEEFFKNVDVGSTSQYYYIDQETGKLTCGPVWDFDIASGVIDTDSPSTYTSYANTDLFVKSRDPFIRRLFRTKGFEDKVKIRYQEVRDLVFKAAIDDIDAIKSDLYQAFNRNINKWPLTHTKETWIEINAYSEKYNNLNSLSSHYTLLKEFLEKRLDVLDNYYGDKNE